MQHTGGVGNVSQSLQNTRLILGRILTRCKLCRFVVFLNRVITEHYCLPESLSL
jgi:hypothetical protein